MPMICRVPCIASGSPSWACSTLASSHPTSCCCTLKAGAGCCSPSTRRWDRTRWLLRRPRLRPPPTRPRDQPEQDGRGRARRARRRDGDRGGLPPGLLRRPGEHRGARAGRRDQRAGAVWRPLRVGPEARLRGQGLRLDYPGARWHSGPAGQPPLPRSVHVLLRRPATALKVTMDIHSLLVTLLSFAVAIGVLVFVHELGHFAVAKRVGVLVERFSIGFGPVILARKRGETEYAVSAIPLGGYVKMLGEEEGEEALANPERAFSTQSVLRRAAIVFAGPALNFVFAFLVYVALFATVGVPDPAN